MNNLIYKELRLSVNPFFYVMPLLLGALMFIPQWIYFFVPLYFCFITVPNFFGLVKAQNDTSFSVLLPVSKSDIVKARLMTIIILEMLHVFFGVVFAIIHNAIYGVSNLFMDPNAAYFGLIFVMFGIFNIILLPMYFKTAYKYGAATIVSTVTAVLFATGVELLVIFNKEVASFLEGDSKTQLYILALGIIVFIAMSVITQKLSVKKFEKVDV